MTSESGSSWYFRNKERARENHRKWRERNKAHRAKYMRKWADDNAADRRQYHIERSLKNPERVKSNWIAYASNNRERLREKQWRREGLPLPTRERPEGCECCGRPNKNGKPLFLDHCHKTNKFRGWLCIRCNSSIGGLGDDIAGLERAIEYLKKNK